MKYDLSKFTLEEKVRLVAGKDTWHTDDLGGKVYKVKVSDGPVGLRTPNLGGEWGGKTIPAVAFPSTQVLAQSWTPALAYKTGELLADECIERDVDVLLAPGINVKRLPQCGRNFEYVSEDPYLSGIFGREYIKGVQDHHVGTSLKHYCANNQENSRLSQSSELDERTLREIYTYNFKIALEAKPWTVMSSYNAVNGVKVSQHKKLNDMLREDLGFEGLIMSDWGAVDDHVASVKSGLDLEMPYKKENYEALLAAVKSGEVAEEELDARCIKVLELCERCESEKKLRKIETTVEERREAAQRVAEDGIVLLKNNGVLPIGDGKSVSVIGEGATKNISGGGSSRVVLDRDAAKLPDELRACLPASEISHVEFYGGKISRCINNAYGKDVSVVCVDQIDSEGIDRDSIRLSSRLEEVIIETARLNPNTVVVLYCGSVIDMSAWGDKVAAIVAAGYPGERGNAAVAKILSGEVNPSGKTTETYPETLEDCLANHCLRDFCHSIYSDGLLVGYRWYDTAKYMGKENEARVRYPFGYGLSYSSFEYSGLKLDDNGDNILVEFDVKNVSDIDGKECAQVYYRKPVSSIFRPYKELCGFEKKLIKSGESEHYTITVPKEYLAYYSTATDKWEIEKGDYEILVGASCEDIRLMGKANI
ncbi:MAG: glycoside hydrolase family 3 protein [Clostridia bacterium]|nr:glycoside hydrolase family 3 protein [Clostridia bacterium]